MTATLTNYGRDQVVGLLVAADIYTPPSSLWLALSLTLLVKNTTSDMMDEPAPSCGYRRLQVPLGSAFWAANGFGEFTETAGASGSLTITEDSGLILGWALADTPVLGEGNLYAVGTLHSPMVLNIAGSPYTADDLTIGLYD